MKFKSFVKKACEKACFLNLLEQKSKISKGKEIVYHQNQSQSYLSPGPNYPSEDICRILKCRIRDVDVKANFKNAYKDLKCPFQLCTSIETQHHLASCKFYPERSLISSNFQYNDLFGSDFHKQFQIMKIIMKRCEIRNEMFQTQLRNKCGPVDLRTVGRPVSGVTNRGTSRQARSLVIRGQTRKKSHLFKSTKKNKKTWRDKIII